MDILTGAGEIVTRDAGRRARRPVPRLPELLRHPRLRRPAPDRARAGHAVRRPAPRPVRRPRRAGRGDRARSAATRALGRRAGRLPRRRRVRARRGLPDPRPLDRRRRRVRAAARRATTPASRSTTGRSASASRDVLTVARLPLALGHRLVLVLAARSARRTRWCAGSGRGRWRRSDVYHKIVGLENRFQVKARIDRAARRARPGAGRPGRRDPGRAHRRLPALVRRATCR